jgi:subtilisin family serine protease
MRLLPSILFLFISLLLSVSAVSAQEVKVTPKISKYNTDALFDEKKEFNSRELIIKFKDSATDQEIAKILESIKLKELSTLKGNFSLVSVPKETDLTSVAENLLKNNFVEFVEPNYKVERNFTPSDPYYKNQWYLKKIQTPKAWDQTKGASNITVAVIDGGVQTNHPDLSGKIVNPYNMVTGGTKLPADEHGTHVAGIIAATINKTGVAGIAPNVKIMPINVFDGEYADTYDIIDAIYYAADKKTDVINLSLGSFSYSYAMDYAASYAKSKGTVLIAAAGNEDTSLETYPAALDAVIGISATDKNDKITSFSNYGNYIDFAAPGQDIYSTVAGSSYRYMDGTSMAAPVVSGVTALVLSKNPMLTPSQVEDILRKSSVDLGRKGWDYLYGYGRIDAYKALQNTPAPASNLTASASNFIMKGTNKVTFSLNVQANTVFSLYIQNSKGSTVRKLVSDKKWSGGKFSASWDGKKDNGTYIAAGTYKVVAKITNGKETIYKSANVKVTDKVVPSIQLSSSTVYSPTVNKKLTIPYQLNKNARVTAKIYDRNNKVVKTILNNVATASGKRSVVWDGKNSKGKKVADGTYKLVMSVTDYYNVKGKSRKMSINVDTVKPTGKMIIGSTVFKMDGKSKHSGKLDFKENVYVTAYVTSNKGVKVKKLISEKFYKPGSYTIIWDGKNDKSQLLPEGKYQYLIEFKDQAGNKTTMKSSLLTLQDWRPPSVSATADLYYSSTGDATFSYTISKPGKVTIEIYSNGTVIRTIQKGISKVKGTHSSTFDGKDESGNILADGKYTYKITMVDAYNLSHFYTGNITVALTKVEITYPTVVQLHNSDDYAAEVFYKLSQPASVTIEIYDSYHDKIRTVVSNAAAKQGINSFTWDGKTDDGYDSYDDSFTYVIKAKNQAGNETEVKGKITNLENPDWLISHEAHFTPSDDNYWEHTQLNLDINVSHPLKAYLYIYEWTYGDLIDQKEYDLAKGINNLVYNKQETSDLYYVLKYEDSLGNTYYYEIQEYEYYKTQKKKL